MSMFTNGVGRPSNETIRKRNIFKGICVLLVIVIIALVAYILNDKGVFNNNIKNSSKNKVTESKKTEENSVDISKIKVENDKDGYFKKMLYNGAEVDINIKVPSKEDAMNYFEIINFKQFGKLALFDIKYNDSSSLAVMNSKGKIVTIFDGNGELPDYYEDESLITKLSGAIYGTFNVKGDHEYYKIENNKLTIYSSDLGQEECYVCNKKDNDIVVFADTYEYKNTKLIKSDSKGIKTAKEYKEDLKANNFNCNTSCR